MREIKFRGKRIDNGEWVYGYYQYEVAGYVHLICNLDGNYEVIPETVGQFTGLQDSSGVDIYEGDIMKITYHGTNSTYDIHREVWWDDETTRFINASKKYEVIGNKWDEK